MIDTLAEREIRPISHWSTNDYVFSLVLPYLQRGARIVDVGAGEGFFSKKMGDHLQSAGEDPADRLAACDLFPNGFHYAGIRCDPVSMDGNLPYPDASFDVACSLEVIEHLEDQFHFVRELGRILKPGGIAIISTPNVLNINSRLRILRSGFAVLFDPLSLSTDDPVHTSGHIHPIPYYYLAYMLSRAGFQHVAPHYDRRKNSARFLLTLAALYLYPARWLFRRRLRHRNPVVELENQQILDDLNSASMLTSRSVIAVGTKGTV
jgi:SAM-dependent methyltransferase